MSHLPQLHEFTSLEQWQSIFLCRLFWLSVACLAACFVAALTLTILIGLNVIVLPYASSLFFSAPALGVLSLFKMALRWLYPNQTRSLLSRLIDLRLRHSST
jgi:hypothetical protein